MAPPVTTYVVDCPTPTVENPNKRTVFYINGVKKLAKHLGVTRMTVWRIMSGLGGRKYDDWKVYRLGQEHKVYNQAPAAIPYISYSGST